MNRNEARRLLDWALPRLQLNPRAFRHVRSQVLKRLQCRASELGIATAEAYQERLERRPEEWRRLELGCRITVSRFYRDAAIFDRVRAVELPRLAEAARRRPTRVLRCWCAGCGAGEEAYTVALCWHGPRGAASLARRFAEVELRIVGTDVDDHQLERARRGCYPAGAMRELPPDLLDELEPSADGYQVPSRCRAGIELRTQDLRREVPEGPFDLVLCRNLAFSYFDRSLQRGLLERLDQVVRPDGLLLLGQGERLPEPREGRTRFRVLPASPPADM